MVEVTIVLIQSEIFFVWQKLVFIQYVKDSRFENPPRKLGQFGTIFRRVFILKDYDQVRFCYLRISFAKNSFIMF